MVEAVERARSCPGLDHLACSGDNCACPCHGTSLPLRETAAEAETVKRIGLGYQGYFPSDGVELSLQRVKESRGEVHGELFVNLRDGSRTGHLFGGNFNASSLTARNSLTKHLTGRVALDWAGVLESFCLAVLRGERRGTEFKVLGQEPTRRFTGYLLEPVLPLSKPTILFGQGGTGKSTLAGGIAVGIATGRCPIPGWTATPGAVLFLDWEEDEETWNERFQAIAIGAGIPKPPIHYRSMARPLSEDLEAVAAYVNQHNILLLIVDAVGLASGSGREGESWHDGTFRLFEAIRQIGATTLLVDHVATSELNASGPAAKPFGSIYKVNLARSVFELRAEREGSGERTELLMLHSKSNGPKLPAQGLAIIREDDVIRFERSDVDAPELVSALSVRIRMQRALRMGALPTRALAETLGVPENTVKSAFTRDQRGTKGFVRLPDGRIGLVN